MHKGAKNKNNIFQNKEANDINYKNSQVSKIFIRRQQAKIDTSRNL